MINILTFKLFENNKDNILDSLKDCFTGVSDILGNHEVEIKNISPFKSHEKFMVMIYNRTKFNVYVPFTINETIIKEIENSLQLTKSTESIFSMGIIEFRNDNLNNKEISAIGAKTYKNENELFSMIREKGSKITKIIFYFL